MKQVAPRVYFFTPVRPATVRHSLGDAWKPVEGYEWIQNISFETLRLSQGEWREK